MMKLRMVWCAVVAVLAVVGLQASAASAGSYECQEGVGATCTVTANVTTVHKFFWGLVEQKCEAGGGKGMFTNGDKSITTSEFNYFNCKFVAAGQTATVKMEGCDFNFGEPTGSASPFTIKTITINCPAGKEITITAATAGCTVKVGSQTTTGTSTVANAAGPPMNATVATAVTGIKYTSSGGICGTAGTFTTGKTEGSFNIKGFSDEAHTKATGITIKP